MGNKNLVINKDLIVYYRFEQLPLSIDNEYPKLLKYYEIGYIPPAEPQVLITDVFNNPQEWYSVPSLIKEQFMQTYVCYFNGLYLASLSCAINTVELVLKYEYVRIEKDPDKLTERYFTLGNIIYNELDKIKLEKFKEELILINDIRSGIYHYNTNKLKSVLTNFNIDYLDENMDYWCFVYFIYNVLSQIFIELYDSPEKTAKHIKEGLDDYKKINQKDNIDE